MCAGRLESEVMVSRLTLGTKRTYDRLMGVTREGSQDNGYQPRAMSPTLVKLSDPLEETEAIVEQLMEADPEGRKINRILRRRRNHRTTFNRDGEALVFGRRCCAVLAQKLDRQLHRLHLPARFTCECGTVYSVEMRTREERRHV